MGEIRKQTIFSSVIIYIGFAFGALNTYFFTKHGLFEPSEYGLTQAIVSIGQVFFALSSLGMIQVMGRFFPYYTQHLKEKDNDLLSLAFSVSLIGFAFVVIGGVIFKPFFIRKFLENAPQLVDYYFWLFPFTFFYLIFSILECHSAVNKQTVLPNFLREGLVRMLTTLLIVLYIFEIIQFDLFVKIFACLYGFTSLCMAYFLRKNNQLRFVLKISPVTRHLKFEIFQFVGYVFTGMVIFSFAQQIDSISITGQIGLTQLGVYILAQYIATVVQVPQRSIASIATPYLAIAWKDSNFDEIRKIYSQELDQPADYFTVHFFNIWLNIDDAYDILGLESIYETGKYVVLILSITKIIDLGTGINSQLLYTSPSWRFELFSGILLLVLSVILNVFLVRRFGIIGAAFANLAAITAYNFIRVLFIYKKYNMQPFSLKTIFSILIAIVTYYVVYLSCARLGGVVAIGTRSVLFSGIFLFMVYIFRLTPDFRLVIDLIQNKLKRS